MSKAKKEANIIIQEFIDLINESDLHCCHSHHDLDEETEILAVALAIKHINKMITFMYYNGVSIDHINFFKEVKNNIDKRIKYTE